MGNRIGNPFEFFTDASGLPLEAGYIYVGDVNQNPQISPIQLYWDSSLTIPAAQPIRTSAGYPVRYGAATQFYTSQTDFSITVLDKNKNIVFSTPSAASISTLQSDLSNSTDRTKGFAFVGTLQFGMSKPGDAIPSERGFWSDDPSGANIWRMRDRLLIGDGVDQDGKNIPSQKTWVGNSANGYMTYFDSRSQVSIYSSKGAVAGAFASRSSDNTEIPGLNTIGVGSYVNNDNTDTVNKKSSWSYYGHAVQTQPNGFTACMEVDVASTQALVKINPYLMGSSGSTVGHWVGVGGETAQSGITVQPCSAAIGIVSSATRNATAGTGSLFDKGIVFMADALAGCDGVTGSATAISMARGHEIEWRYSAGAGATGGKIRSDNTNSATQTRIIFGNSGLVFRSLKNDGVTENNLMLIVADQNAVNYLQVQGGATGTAVQISANGTDTDVDLKLGTKGNGRLALSYAVTNATTPASFTAQQILAFKDASGTTYYIPCRAAQW